MVDTTPVPCECSRCTEPLVVYDGDRRVVMNNVHGRVAPCPDCGRAMTEYLDLGRRGVYRCWWCNDRAASTVEVPP